MSVLVGRRVGSYSILGTRYTASDEEVMSEELFDGVVAARVWLVRHRGGCQGLE